MKLPTVAESKGPCGDGFVVIHSAPALFAVFGAAHVGQKSLTTWLGVHEFPADLRRLVEASEDEGGKVAVWVTLMVAAFLTKLTSSTDDVVWLFPFLKGRTRTRNMIFYVACMQLIVCLSWGFTASGESLLSMFTRGNSSWPLAKILQLISAVLLNLYTFKLLRDWWLERQAAARMEINKQMTNDGSAASVTSFDSTVCNSEVCSEVSISTDTFGSVPPTPPPTQGLVVLEEGSSLETTNPSEPPESGSPDLCVTQSASVAMEPTIEIAKKPMAAGGGDLAGVEVPVAVETNATSESPEKYSLKALFTIALFGSLDDFAVYVSMLLSGILSPFQLFLGTFFGSVVVVIVCVAAGKCACLSKMIEKVPLWVIIGAFSAWTYISTFTLA